MLCTTINKIRNNNDLLPIIKKLINKSDLLPTIILTIKMIYFQKQNYKNNNDLLSII